MANYLVIILFFVSSVSYGQGYANFGNTNPNDTARTVNNVLINKYLRLPIYAPALGDTGILSTRTPGGNVFAYSLQSLAGRIGAIIGSPGLQTVLSTNSNLTQDNTLLGPTYNMTFRFKNIYVRATASFWEGQTYVVNNPISYDLSLAPTLPNHVVTKQYVDGLATKSSFDTVMITTVTALTSNRFTVPFRTVNYAGMTWNSDYFNQDLNTGTITFVGLIFYNGQKLTFQK